MKSIFILLFLFSAFSSAQPVPVCQHGKCGFVDASSGKKIFDFNFDAAKPFCASLAPVMKKGKWGMVDSKGRLKLKPQFSQIKECSGNIFAAEKKKLWGYINDKGESVSDFEFQDALAAKNGLAPAKKNGFWGIYNLNTKEFTPTPYEEIFPFSQGLARVKKNGRYGYIDESLKEVLPPVYEKAFDFNDGYTSANLAGDWGFISKETLAFKKKDFENLGPYSQGLAPAYAQIDAVMRCGYVDKDGIEKISFSYAMCAHFSQGLAPVLKTLKGKWGFIDTNGSPVTEFKYDSVYGFKNGISLVTAGGEAFYIDRNGKEYR